MSIQAAGVARLDAFLLGALLMGIVALAARMTRSAFELGLIAAIGLTIAAFILVPIQADQVAPAESPTTTATLTPSAAATPVGIPVGERIPPAPTPTQPPACENVLVNPGFETGAGWIVDRGGCHPLYSRFKTQAGDQSLLLGIPVNDPNLPCNSSALQKIAVPANVSRATMSFWFWTASGGGARDDRYEVVLLSEEGQELLVLLRGNKNVWAWRHYQEQLDLSPFAGQTLFLRLQVHNDGVGAHAFMYVDDVDLDICRHEGKAPETSAGLQSSSPTDALVLH